jgi:hypothetical protein
MFSDLAIGFLVAASLTAWTYAKLMRTSGGNSKSSLTAALILGALTMLIVSVALGFIFKHR